MKRLATISFLGVSLVLSFFRTSAIGINPQVIVIEGGTLIDGAGGPPVEDSVVVISGSRITAEVERAMLDVKA